MYEIVYGVSSKYFTVSLRGLKKKKKSFCLTCVHLRELVPLCSKMFVLTLFTYSILTAIHSMFPHIQILLQQLGEPAYSHPLCPAHLANHENTAEKSAREFIILQNICNHCLKEVVCIYPSCVFVGVIGNYINWSSNVTSSKDVLLTFVHL